jgi:hypothetical protein
VGKRKLFLFGVPLLLVAAAACGLSLTNGVKAPAEAETLAERRPRHDVCGSRKAYEQLKARVFAEAEGIRGIGSSSLDLLASFSSVRMEQPLLKSRDDDLGITVCTGRLVLLLPPGAEQGVGGRRYLHADVEYAAVPAADGSGLIYQVRGADSVIYRLAAFNLRAAPARPDIMAAFMQRPRELPPAASAAEAFPAPPAIVSVALALPDAESAAPEEARKRAAAPANKDRLKPAEQPRKPLKLAKNEEPVEAEKVSKRKEPAEKPKVSSVKSARDKKAESTKGKRAELAAAEKKMAKKKKDVKTEATKTAKTKPAKKVVLASSPKDQSEAKAKKSPAAQKVAAVNSKEKPATAKIAKRATQAKPDKAPRGEPKKELAQSSPELIKPKPRKAPAAVKTGCAAARSKAERLLCSNPDLAAKKRAATNFHNAALEHADTETRRILNSTRADFSAYLDRCGSASCMEEAYDQRLYEIREILADAR